MSWRIHLLPMAAALVTSVSLASSLAGGVGTALAALPGDAVAEAPARIATPSAPSISEFMAANVSILADEDGDFSDWIEILNPGLAALDLEGWFLTDDPRNLAKWCFPLTTLPPGERLLVFASGKDRRTPGLPLHANFQLGSDGEYLALLRPDGTVVSGFAPTFPKQKPDVSYGLVGDSGTNAFLAMPTPGAANVADIAHFVADTKFSHDRGLYETNFTLTITCETPGATVYYTTNGSSPSATNGAVVTGPIPIRQTTVIRARAEKPGFRPSNVDTHTYLFVADIVAQSPNGAPPPGWPASWGDNVVDYGMDPDIVRQLPWSATISNDLRTVPSISLVMRSRDLFNAQTGIYANATSQGLAWERPCSLELIYPDGRKGFAVCAGARIRGRWSRYASNPKHSLRFILRDDYGDPKLRFPFFGPDGADEFDKFDLRTPTDYSWAFLGDANALFNQDSFARDTLLALGQAAERGDWYHLYINGQYWGLYNSCERPEANYAASYFGGAPEDYDVLKPDDQFDWTVRVVDGDDGAWTRLWRAATNGFGGNAAYFGVQGRNSDGTLNPALENLLDVTNLVDYLLSIFWTGNWDGPLSSWSHGADPNDDFLNNFSAIRSRKNTGGFRFLTHDAEMTLDNLSENRVQTTTVGDPERGHGPEYSNPYYLWTRLLENTEFHILLADRIQKHFFGSGALTREACTARFLVRKVELDRAIVGESARWGDAQDPSAPLTRDDWISAINDSLTTYFPYRADVVLDQLREAGLFPSLGAPAVSPVSGEVPFGSSILLSHTNLSGEIFYTLDGSDPRAIGGSISVAALNYGAAIPVTGSVSVRARVKDGAAWSPLVEATFYPAQDFSGLGITEVMFNPLPDGMIDGDEFEFLELKNGSTNTIDIGGASFTGLTFSFTNGTRLAPGAFLVLARSAAFFAARYPGVAFGGVYSGRLDNGGEKIAMKTALGVEILSLAYNDRTPWPVAADGYGFSLVPLNPAGVPDPNDGRQWRASRDPGGSPGADDPPPDLPPIVISEFLTRTEPPQTDAIELFNPTAYAVDLGGWYLTDDKSAPRKFRIPDGTMIAPGGYVVFTEADFNGGAGVPPAFNEPFVLNAGGEEVYLFSGTPGGTNLTGYTHGWEFGPAALGISFGRYLNSAGEEQFPAQAENTLSATNAGPRVGPAVINEIHYHPLTNYDEYVELLNITETPLDLFDPAFPTNTWQVNGLGFQFPTNVTLPAGGLALIAGIDPAVFRVKYAVPQEVPVFGPFGGVLQNDGERLELQRPDTPNTNGSVPYFTVDEVRYNDHAPWPIAADGDGPALQRLVPRAYGNDPTNWFASGLTPGRSNHLNQVPIAVLLSPTNGAAFTWPAAITLEASVSDADGVVTRVEFLDGSEKIGEVTEAPYRQVWSAPRTGARRLSVKVHDNELASSLSAPVAITVEPPSPGNGFGLRAEYFNDSNLGGAPVLRLDPTIDFTWPDQPHTGIRADAFSVRWTGRLQPPITTTYTLYTRSADGVRLWLDGTNVIDNWTEHAETEDAALVALEAGRLYDLRLEFYNGNGLARIQLGWAAPVLPREVVSRTRLYPPANPSNQPPTVVLLSPTHDCALPPGSLDLRAAAADPDGALCNVSYFTNGVLLGERIAPPFDFTWPNPPRGTHHVTAVAVDDNLVAATSDPVTVHIVTGYMTNQTLITYGSLWRYWDLGSLPALDWTNPDYDDTGWTEGFAQLGYGDLDEATVVSYGPNQSEKYITTYFRTMFNLESPETISSLQFRVIRDDGMALYLNGQEALRDNLPAGPLGFATTALNSLGPPEESTPVVVGVSAASLRSGVNVVAGEIHQANNYSSDLSFDLELTVTRSRLAPFILTQPEGAHTSLGAPVSLQVVAGGSPPLEYQWCLAGTRLTGETNSMLTLAGLQLGQVGPYTVVVTNALGATTSQVASVAVTNPPKPELSIALVPQGVRLSFTRIAGYSHTLQTSRDLMAGSWQTLLGLPAAASTEPFALTLPIADPPALFFRVMNPSGPSPRLSIGSVPGGVRLSFIRTSGHSCSVQRSCDLMPDSWRALIDLPVPAITEPFTVTLPIADPPAVFFRVEMR